MKKLSPIRLWWKNVYRMIRLTRKEYEKASLDLAIFGNSFMLVDENGYAKHIPFKEAVKENLILKEAP